MTSDIIRRFRDEVEPGDALAIRMKGLGSMNPDKPDFIYSGRVFPCSDTVYPSDVSPFYGIEVKRRYEVGGDRLKTERIDKWTNIGECRGRLGVLDWAITLDQHHDPAVALMSTTTIVEFVAGQMLRGDALLSDDDSAVSAKFVDAAARVQGQR